MQVTPRLRSSHDTLHGWKQQSVSSAVFSRHPVGVLLIRINWDYLLTQQKRVCCVHVIVCAQGMRLCFSTWMLQEISESSSNRIVQRTSWSRERLLGLRNRSIFILVLIRFQLLASADAQPGQKHAGSEQRRTHARTRAHVCVFLLGPFFGGGMKGWRRERMSRRMDGCNRAGGERLHTPPACPLVSLQEGGAFSPPPPFSRFYTIGGKKNLK